MKTWNGFEGFTAETLEAGATYVKIAPHPNFAALSNSLEDGYTYLVLDNGVDYEAVKVTSAGVDGFVIERSSGSLKFPKGTCVRYDATDPTTASQIILDVTGAAEGVQELISSDGSISFKQDCGTWDLSVGSGSYGNGIKLNKETNDIELDLCGLEEFDCPDSSTKIPACRNGKNILLDYATLFTASGQASSGCGGTESTVYTAGSGINISESNVISQITTLGGEIEHMGVTYDAMGNAIEVDQSFSALLSSLPNGTYCGFTLEDGVLVSGSQCESGEVTEYTAGRGITFTPNISDPEAPIQIAHKTQSEAGAPYLNGTQGPFTLDNGHVVGYSSSEIQTDTPEAIDPAELENGFVNHVETLETSQDIGALTVNKTGHIKTTPILMYGVWTRDDNSANMNGVGVGVSLDSMDGINTNTNIYNFKLDTNLGDNYSIVYSLELIGDTITDGHQFTDEIRNQEGDTFEIMVRGINQGAGDGIAPKKINVQIMGKPVV